MNPAEPRPSAPPSAALRARLDAVADALASRAPEEARALREAADAWWREQQAWELDLARALSLHHEINNALVGVRGNAQLVLLGPHGREPAVRDRLEVVIRESERIREAAARLRGIRSGLGADGGSARAA
uniref:Signal transduction histidine kinase dimerisation/phosphoacceptor domain-containing protein n=1 Tax=Eiseniibacteriota bacterium TaxID=2212470 RepID=A0A832I004_UNCEI